MNLSEQFLPSSLEWRTGEKEQEKGRHCLGRMPPRSGAKDVISGSEEAMMAATMMDRLHLATRGGAGAGGGNNRGHASREEKDRREVRARPSDLTFYVGRTRVAYTLSADTLRHSTYFASLLERHPAPDPVVLDCDEATFQSIVLILRYGSFHALPKMSESELFRLKRELECYGIDVPEPPPSPVSSSSTTSSPQRFSPSSHRSQSLQTGAVKAVHQHQYQHQHQHHHLQSSSGVQFGGECQAFPDLPEELKEPGKLYLVARMDDIEKGIRCECTGKDLHTYWALSFHYRHTFCTGCGRSPHSFPPRHLAEMYMGAAMYYSNESFASRYKWSVGCDSTCSLKLLTAKPGCVCPCSGRSESFIGDGNDSPKRVPAWAVSTYYSHAFCTRCGEAADERTLIYILLTHRYGGGAKHQSKLRRDHVSDGAVAQDARVLANSSGLEIRHQRGNRSM